MKKILIIVGIVIIVIAGWTLITKQENTLVATPDRSKQKTYRSKNIVFVYPVSLSLKVESDGTRLTHSIKYRHPDPCDMRGDSLPLEQLSDFDLKFKMVWGGVQQSMEGDNLQLTDGLKEYPGYIEQVKFDQLTGYRAAIGVEGCGQNQYYFPAPNGRTLVIEEKWIPELNPNISLEAAKYIKLPNIIKPDQAGLILKEILNSVRLVGV